MNIHKYTPIAKVILLVVFTFCTTHIAFAQEEDVKWYENEDEAIDVAKKQNKNILLLWGTNACGDCIKVKRMLSEDSTLKKLINEGFVLWFCDFNKSEQGDKYRLLYDFKAPPLICVINPQEPITPAAHITGRTFVNELRALLKNNVDLNHK